MKKLKLAAVMLAASMALTACGTDGGGNKAGVFAGVKAANRATDRVNVITSDEACVNEMAHLVNQMEYTEVEYEDIPDMSQEEKDSGFIIEFNIDSEDDSPMSTTIARKYIDFESSEYCGDVYQNKYYQITSADDTVYSRLKQLVFKLRASNGDYVARLRDMNSSNTVANDQVQQDTDNPNYQEWMKGMYSDLAAVPDRGNVKLYCNAYLRNETSYILDSLSDEDFDYLTEKYQSEGFDRDVVRTENGFFAYSSNSTYDYVSMRRYEDGFVILTLGRDLDSVDASASQWEAATYGGYLPKPEAGQCFISYDHPTPCPDLDMDSYTDFIVMDVDKKQAEEYIDKCRQNGYTDLEEASSSSEDGLFWTGCSADGKTYIEVVCEYQNGYMKVCVGGN